MYHIQSHDCSAGTLMQAMALCSLQLRLQLPRAPRCTASLQAVIFRAFSSLAPPASSSSSSSSSAATTTAVIALGSNLGDRALHIERALRLLEAEGVAAVVDTSFLYETRPAYVTEQPPFLNAACRVRTSAAPAELLAAAKRVERALGREPTVRNGPRTVDVDILCAFDFVNVRTLIFYDGSH
jgi:dihydroneopterin aldolase/2-amino-4-hydroxy-6-hydroxymethyldihydropteridine diphosphokinase/dihydropteroate synthase